MERSAEGVIFGHAFDQLLITSSGLVNHESTSPQRLPASPLPSFFSFHRIQGILLFCAIYNLCHKIPPVRKILYSRFQALFALVANNGFHVVFSRRFIPRPASSMRNTIFTTSPPKASIIFAAASTVPCGNEVVNDRNLLSRHNCIFMHFYGCGFPYSRS